MSHDNRAQVRVPRRLWDEMMLALDQSLARIEYLDAQARLGPDEPTDVVTRQMHEFGQRVLSEARRRQAKQSNE